MGTARRFCQHAVAGFERITWVVDPPRAVHWSLLGQVLRPIDGPAEGGLAGGVDGPCRRDPCDRGRRRGWGCRDPWGRGRRRGLGCRDPWGRGRRRGLGCRDPWG